MDIETFKALDEPAKFAAAMFAYVPYPLNSASVGMLLKRRFGELPVTVESVEFAALVINSLETRNLIRKTDTYSLDYVNRAEYPAKTLVKVLRDAERGRLVDAFQSGEGDFFVISLKAGGTGLNLTAADYVILLDPWWNPAVENQAADRAHRIGQRNPVTVYRLIAADTVEERVLELHKEKKQIAEDVLDGTGSAALSPAQLMGLFKSSNPDSSNSVSHGK